jgi:hypothetical protein
MLDLGEGFWWDSTLDYQWAKDLAPQWGQEGVSPLAPMLVWEKVCWWASTFDHWWAKESAPPWGQGGVSW